MMRDYPLCVSDGSILQKNRGIYLTIIRHMRMLQLRDFSTVVRGCVMAPLLEEICHDKGRARGPSGSYRAASEAPDGDGDHTVLAGDYGGAACRGECGIAGLWAIPTPPPPAARWTQPTHAAHGSDSS